MATTTNESSVMMALSELRKLEDDRIAAQQRAAEAARAEAERQAREAAEAERRRVELERARVEAEAKAKALAEVARDGSLEELRARVAAVQAEREALRTELRARVDRAAEPAPRSPWALAFGLSSVVAAGLAGLLVLQTSQAIGMSRIEASPRAPAATVASVEERAAIETEEIAPALEAPAAPETEAPAPEQRRVRRDRVRHDARDEVARDEHRHDDRDRDLEHDLGLDDDEDDVLGGITAHQR